MAAKHEYHADYGCQRFRKRPLTFVPEKLSPINHFSNSLSLLPPKILLIRLASIYECVGTQDEISYSHVVFLEQLNAIHVLKRLWKTTERLLSTTENLTTRTTYVWWGKLNV